MFNIESFFFYLFSSLMVSSAFLVIRAKNPVHSVLFLILVFCNATALLLTYKVEFLSILFIIIYVGAVAVLFLFVVMMLDIKLIQMDKNNYGYLPLIIIIVASFLIESFILLKPIFFTTSSNSFEINYILWYQLFDSVNNIEIVGQLLYTYYALFVLIAGMILLTALIGPVALTLNQKTSLIQDISNQVSRNSLNAIFNIKNNK